jgi:hypothetical protein
VLTQPIIDLSPASEGGAPFSNLLHEATQVGKWGALEGVENILHVV